MPRRRSSGAAGLRPEDRPFQPSLSIAGDVELLLDLAPAQSVPARAMRLAVIANALDAAHVGDGRWTFYSRDRTHYALRRRFSPPGYTRTAVVAAVEALASKDFLEHQRTRPSPAAEFRSRFRAAPALIERLADVAARDFVFELREPIILRDAEGDETPCRESRRIRAMRRDVEAQNLFLGQHEIGVVHPDVATDSRGFLLVRGRCINPGRRRLYRVFNGSFALGGRWYGGWWQGLPADVRAGILIDGEPTVELDYHACHLRLLAASARVALPFDDPGFDPFSIPGVERRHAKLAFHVMLNASAESSALRALGGELDSAGAHPYAAELAAAVRARFPEFAPYWSTGVGLRLQRVDSDICAAVQRRLRGSGIACLSLHDSFIAPARHRAELDAVMTPEFDRACDRLRRRSLPHRRRAAR
jgi:hypothetical protein